MEDSPHLHPTCTEDVEAGTLQSRSDSGALPDPDAPKPELVEEQPTSFHDTLPSFRPSLTNGPDSCLTDMDCPVCFSRYNIYRVPKELSCKHNFCAVCLKLLVHNELGTWRIVCPVCRATTPVFGGLVCTLQNQESLLSRLESPNAKARVLEPSGTTEMAIRLDGHGYYDLGENERHGNLRIAARRLVILLLILLILLIIILQFVCTGIMKWVLGFTLGVVVIIAVLLCFNPNCRMRLPRVGSQQKDNDAV